MGKSSAPAPPDYTGAANATGTANRQNTQMAYGLSNPNISGPNGSVNYSAVSQDQLLAGQHPTVTTTLSPAEQQVLSAQHGVQLGAIPVAQNLTRGLQGMTGQFDTSGLPNATQGADAINHNVVDSLYKQRQQYLDPQYQQGGDALTANLRAQGLQPGDKAYEDAQKNFGLQKQQAYGDALSSAQGQGVQAGYLSQQENLAARSAGLQEQELKQMLPGQELSSLAQYLQPQGPSVQGTQGVSAPGAPNLLGASQAGYESALGATNAQNASTAQTESTIGSLALLAFLAS